MTKEEFRELTQDILFLDGATGTNMLAAGMPRGTCTEQWILEHKPVIQRLQDEYIKAGSQIIYAPTFGANRISLRNHQLGDHVRELNVRLMEYARETAAGHALVAGDITTTGRIVGFSDHYEYEDAYDNYCEQIGLLAENGADLIVAETMIGEEETMAAVNACRNTCDLPILSTVSVRSGGNMFYGGNIVEFAPELEAAGVSAVGVNCSLSPAQLTDVIGKVVREVKIPVIAKPNAGIPLIDEDGRAIYHVTPEAFASQMIGLREAGASILGGCCGTTPEHIRELVRVIRGEKAGDSPESDMR